MRSCANVLLAAVLYLQHITATPLKPIYAGDLPPEEPHKLYARNGLDDYWPGLNWNTARTECSQNQMSKIQTALYGALSLGRAAYNSHISWDGAFEQFFNSGWGRVGDTQNYAEDIWQNMNASITYPRNGDAKGRFRQAWQLAIRCRETVAQPQCGVPGRRVLAYVIQGSGEMGPQVSFCPDFFDPTIKNAPRDLNSLYRATPTDNLNLLMTTGQIVLHEFMHVEKFGHCEKIIDMKSSLPSLNGAVGEIYGKDRCDEYAHIHGSGIPNVKVTSNADNYAWWASGVYWSNVYKIPVSKFRLRDLESRQDDGESDGPNNGFAFSDDPDDPSYQADDAEFTAPAPQDIAECSMDLTNPDQPSMNCDGQNDDPPDNDDPAVDPIFTAGAASTTLLPSAAPSASTTLLPPAAPSAPINGSAPSVPSAPSAAPTTMTAPPPAYATGTCSFHVNEWESCADDSKNLYADITMYDNSKVVIGQTVVDTGTLGVSISTAYSFTSKLADPMVVIGEHQNDYIQFTIGTIAFTSRTMTGPATCSNGGWDPRDGPVCNSRSGVVTPAKNQVDCSFPC